ncbi:MAG TPA: hypothetical protein VG963_03640 [Polyangiaceae bacterium]|nr:hypothetical protein [Polyangiaceae bacterium]
MRKISSSKTFFYKKLFPVFWFGMLGLFVTITLKQPTHGPLQVPFLLMPAVMAVIGYVVMRKLVWDLADEVYDCGDHLLVKSHGREFRLSLAEIINVSSMIMMNPPRITLRLAEASSAESFGNEISFSPDKPFTLNPFAKSEIAEDLMLRVDRARCTRSR